MKKYALLMSGTLLFGAYTPSYNSNDPKLPQLLALCAFKALEATLSAYILVKMSQWIHSTPTENPWEIHRKGSIKDNFSSMAGNNQAIEAFYDIINYLKNSTPYDKIGAYIPKGILLYGPPGTGKTLLARALAGEANCNFIATSGSAFQDKYVGVGANRIRSLFKTARSFNGPCIIFIDEIDGLIKKRGDSDSTEHATTLNEFLSQMDGFKKDKHPIIVIGATNRIDIADPAAIRPGRFDRTVYVGLPTLQERQAILELHAKTKKCVPTINLAVIAQKTSGCSGADLANLMNEAAIITLKSKRYTITQQDLEIACDEMIMGAAYKNKIISPEEKKVTAYHEAGHALAHVLLNSTKSTLHKVSIISRGSSGGHTAFLPEECMYYTKEEFINQIIISLGGRAAEQIMFNTTMTGPSHDISTATHIAKAMVCTYGMSNRLGPVSYQYNNYGFILPYAQTTLSAIDNEIRTIIEECYQRALDLLTQNKANLDTIAQALIAQEELTAQEVYALVQQLNS